MSVFIGYPSFMAYQMMKGKKGNNDGFPSVTGMIARYSALGLTNEQMAENPVWKDLTGNGHDLQMKNFAWKGMSGVGGYGDENYQTFYKFTLDDYTFLASPPGVKHMNFTFRVTGLQPGNKLTLAFFGTTVTIYGTWDKDGIYTVNSAVVVVGKPVYFYNGYGATRGEFTIEILPLYPGALVFDGVDDWAGCDNLPLLPKEKGYSIIALRKWITRYDATQYKRPLISNLDTNDEGAFLIEYRKDENVNDVTGSYNSFTDVYIDDNNPITWQTSSSYNGQIIKKGTSKSTNKLCICKTYFGQLSNYANAAIWELVILDHDATEEELTKIKDYFIKTYPWLFPDQAWTVVGKTNEDEDRATIANITGNGNDLVLYNFGFAEGSGYGSYFWNFKNFQDWNTVTEVTNSKIVLKGSASNFWGSQIVKTVGEELHIVSKVKVTGLTDEMPKLYFGKFDTGDKLQLTNGINNINKIIFAQYGWYGFGFEEAFESCNVTIEQIPEYEGYLVTDGVDDKIESPNFKLDKDFTIVGEWEFLNASAVSAGIAKENSLRVFDFGNHLVLYLNSTSERTAYYVRSLNAICSDGRIYDNNWTEYQHEGDQSVESSNSALKIGYLDTYFDKLAFKNFAIYPKVLSKDDCIKAYNYPQTLKAK